MKNNSYGKNKNQWEATQVDNPHQITIKQHIHSAHAISKFYNHQNKVEVFYKDTRAIKKKSKKSEIFCTKRKWDQRAEMGYMHLIEEEYFHELENTEKRNHHAITKYWILLKLRYYFSIQDSEDIQLNGFEKAISYLTKDEEEVAEIHHVSFARGDGIIPSRFIVGDQIQIGIMSLFSRLKDYKWGLLLAKTGEFLVADVYDDIMILPAFPDKVLLANLPDSSIKEDDIKKINKLSIQSAKNFYFARDLSRCPI